MKFYLAHQFENYRDFEPVTGIEVDGLARITFNDDTHTAYGTKVNPEATIDNWVPTMSDETIALSWEDAEKKVGLA